MRRRRGAILGGAGERHAGCEAGGPRPRGIHTELQQKEPRHPTGRPTVAVMLCRAVHRKTQDVRQAGENVRYC